MDYLPEPCSLGARFSNIHSQCHRALSFNGELYPEWPYRESLLHGFGCLSGFDHHYGSFERARDFVFHLQAWERLQTRCHDHLVQA